MTRCSQQSACWLLALVGLAALTIRGGMAADAETAAGTTYAKDGATYTARHVFLSSLPAANLLGICFEFKHLKEFYHQSEVKLVKSGTDWQTVEYRSDYKVGTTTATYKKTIDLARHTVSFTMLSHRVSGWGMPVMTVSSGSYAISTSGNPRSITYEQSVTLSKEIGTLDWMMIQRKTNGFFADFEAYVRQQESLRAKSAQPPKKGSKP
ncbi:MAG: hypothetical protein WCS43_14755 [Verrucomicrobiota bacterium]